MGQLKEQLFLQHLNQSLAGVRARFRSKYSAKKSDRFMVKGVTYEIGPCRVEGDEFAFEISSKIPQELLPEKVKKERFFKDVLRQMKKGAKKPASFRMENIISATQEEELKERDYVNLTYRFREQELYTGDMVTKRLKHLQDKGQPIPAIPGVATPAGRIVMILVEENIADAVTRLVNDLIAANEATVVALGGSFARAPRKTKGAAKKATATKKPAAKKKAVAQKPAAKKKPVTKKKAAAKKPAAKKTASKKPTAKKKAAQKKSATTKKVSAKKTAAKKKVAAKKKPVAKKAAVKKPAATKKRAKKAAKKKK